MSTNAPPICDQCSYDISVSIDRCPECGTPLDARTGLPWQHAPSPATLVATVWHVLWHPAAAFADMYMRRQEGVLVALNMVVPVFLISLMPPLSEFVGLLVLGHPVPRAADSFSLWIAGIAIAGGFIPCAFAIIGILGGLAAKLGFTTLPRRSRSVVYAYATCAWMGAAIVGVSLTVIFSTLTACIAVPDMASAASGFLTIGVQLGCLTLYGATAWNVILLAKGLSPRPSGEGTA